MEQIRKSDDILIKSYVSSSLPSNDDLVYSSKLKDLEPCIGQIRHGIHGSVQVLHTRHGGRDRHRITLPRTHFPDYYIVFKDGDAVDVVQQYHTGDLRRLVEKYV
ncbi:hypothetical protein Bca101_058579 [Brassica carinata]